LARLTAANYRSRMKNALALIPLACLALAGCAEKTAAIPPMSPVSTTSAKVRAKTPAELAAEEEAMRATAAKEAAEKNARGAGKDAGVTTAGLHLSEGIAQACGLSRAEPAPHFDFDSTTLPEGDREVLASLAKCLEGPLKGKSVVLVGRADARGEPEYNMGLGESRSDVVKRYLIDLGVADARLKASSRGEIDATGKDEEGWAMDRRVDIDVH
jgi:peptidoglycan-associated lipoprotein